MLHTNLLQNTNAVHSEMLLPSVLQCRAGALAKAVPA